MQFYNSRDKNHVVNFKEALMEGLAPGGGLYCPAYIPEWTDSEIEDLLNEDRCTLATEVLHAYTSENWSKQTLSQIVKDAINFKIPLEQISPTVSILELFHGPTEAFKDVGARFMARAMSHFIDDKKLTILVATSGDTGSAVAHGFWNVEGINVIVLFPKNGVSAYQESQMTTLGGNIQAVEVEGTFDDCQDMVKRAFQDKSITSHKNLSSANSINIGRLLPQTLYYYFLAQQLILQRNETIVCVPSGNFGNITSGLYAHHSGLKFKRFIAATNVNKTFPEYLATGHYRPRKSVRTLSNAMDVGKPSNFERLLELYNDDIDQMRHAINSVSISDVETTQTIKDTHERWGYLLDPHAAVGIKAAQQLAPKNSFVVLGTANARKFEKAVHQALPSYKFEYPENDRKAHKETISTYDELLQLII